MAIGAGGTRGLLLCPVVETTSLRVHVRQQLSGGRLRLVEAGTGGRQRGQADVCCLAAAFEFESDLELEGALQHHTDAHAELSNSGTVVQRIMRRLNLRRAIYVGVALLLLGAIIIVIWLKSGGS